MKLPEAQSLAEKVMAALGPLCSRIVIAGSVRRLRPVCRDVDLVCEPRDLPALKDRARAHCEVIKDGDEVMILRNRAGQQIDLFFARPPQADLLTITPGNWGTVLLCRTGSTEHNLWILERAKNRGLSWSPNKGVLRSGQVIASETEKDIFSALELPFIPPEKREDW